MRAVQGEGGDLDVEAFAVPGFHLIAARPPSASRALNHLRRYSTAVAAGLVEPR